MRQVFCIGAVVLMAATGAGATPAEAQSHEPMESELPRRLPNFHILTDTPRKGTPEQNFRIRLAITGDGRLLWSGDLVLAEYNGARIESDIQDTDLACPPEKRAVATRRSVIIAKVVPVDLVEGYEFKVYAHWARRHEECAAPGQKVSRIDVRMALAPDETRVVQGDGGLRVEVTRLP